MGGEVRVSKCGLLIAALLLSSCGGGGGGGGGGTSQTNPSAPTPLRTVSNRNERTESSGAGSITLRLQDIDLSNDQTTNFSVFLMNSSGGPAANQHINISAPGLEVQAPSMETAAD